MKIQFNVAEKGDGAYWHLALLRWTMVFIFIWFGIQKFTPYAENAIEPLITHSPFMSWLGIFGMRGEAKVVGAIELITAALLIVGSVAPVASALGAAFACVTFILTVSFVFSTPDITLYSATGFPVISTLVEQFLIKDVVPLAACITLLLASLTPCRRVS